MRGDQTKLANQTRAAVDLLLAALLALNAAAIGVTLGAYGRRAATAIAPRGVPEFAALSLAASAYMSTRKQASEGGSLAVIAALCTLLLAIAAALETYASAAGASPRARLLLIPLVWLPVALAASSYISTTTSRAAGASCKPGTPSPGRRHARTAMRRRR